MIRQNWHKLDFGTYKEADIEIEKRVELEKVKKAIRKYVDAVDELHKYKIFILGYMMGGKDNDAIFSLRDELTHKLHSYNYGGNGYDNNK